jgi:hypothetical protein
MLQFGALPPMKMREGETPGEPLISSNSARGDNLLDCPMARPPKTRIFIEDVHCLIAPPTPADGRANEIRQPWQ